MSNQKIFQAELHIKPSSLNNPLLFPLTISKHPFSIVELLPNKATL